MTIVRPSRTNSSGYAARDELRACDRPGAVRQDLAQQHRDARRARSAEAVEHPQRPPAERERRHPPPRRLRRPRRAAVGGRHQPAAADHRPRVARRRRDQLLYDALRRRVGLPSVTHCRPPSRVTASIGAQSPRRRGQPYADPGRQEVDRAEPSKAAARRRRPPGRSYGGPPRHRPRARPRARPTSRDRDEVVALAAVGRVVEPLVGRRDRAHVPEPDPVGRRR